MKFLFTLLALTLIQAQQMFVILPNDDEQLINLFSNPFARKKEKTTMEKLGEGVKNV